MHPVSIPASAVPNTNTKPIFEPIILFIGFSVLGWSLFANLFFILSFMFLSFLRCIIHCHADLRRDFFAHPLSCLLEAVLQFVVGLLRASLCTVPSGLGSVLDVLKLFVQLPRLLAQRLTLWCDFGLGGITGFFNFGCE